jgi:5'-3' exonuclease
VRTLLVDGDNLFKIGFHGVREFYVDGNHIGGVFHFLNTLRKQLEQNEYDKVIVFWDGNNNSVKRRELYPDYKLNRKNNMTEEKLQSYYFQKNRVKQYLEECFVRQIDIDNNEADDLVAYYCIISDTETKTIFSSDRDYMQLLSEKVSIYSPIQKYLYQKGDKVRLEKEWIPHENIFVSKVMLGDKSDNIFGIYSLGEKTFIKLFPEVLEKPVSVDDILTKAKLLQEQNKDNKVLNNILNGVTKNGEFGEHFYKTNKQIVDLNNPIISEDAMEMVRLFYEESLDPEGRTSKNIIQMMNDDGFFKYLPKDDDSFVNFIKPILKLTRKEKRKHKQTLN